MLQIYYLYRQVPKKIRLVLFSVIPILLCLCLNLWQTRPVLAQYLPVNQSNSGNPWQYASFPVENFQTYTSGFGYRISPISGSRQFHYGLDMAAPLGSYVRNWWTGQVIELSDNTNCGTMIKIESGQWQHIYCHLMGRVEDTPSGRSLIDSSGGILLTLGQIIPYGTRIARIGVTGNTTGPHLHWGLKYNGEYIDPGLVLREMYQQQSESPAT